MITICSEADDTKYSQITVSVTGTLSISRPKAKKTGDNEITITWTDVENAAGYNIYRSQSQQGKYEKINDTLIMNAAYKDEDLDKGTYYYKVEAIAPENHAVYKDSEQSMQSIGVKITDSLYNMKFNITDIALKVGES